VVEITDAFGSYLSLSSFAVAAETDLVDAATMVADAN